MRTRKALNIVAIVLFSCLLASVGATKVCLAAGVEFPAWTGIGEERTSLEGRYYQKMPEFTAESFNSGGFQDECESFLADSLPLRDKALLLNSGLQRTSIAIAARPLGFTVYPTHFNSSIAYDSENDKLLDIPATATEETLGKYKKFAKRIEKLSDKYDDADFFVMTPARSGYVNDSPLVSLVPNALTQSTIDQVLSENLENTTLVSFPADYETHKKWWFRTDHHWNMNGAFEGYKALASALGFEDELAGKGDVVYESPAFYGLYCRYGLTDQTSEVLSDYDFDLPTYKVSIDGEKASPDSVLHPQDKQADVQFSNRYSNRYHADYTIITYDNPEKKNGKTLLLVGDSYTNCMERLLASHYAKVIVFDPREQPENDGKTVSKLIEEYEGFDDVVFLFNTQGAANDETLKALK